MHCRFCSKPSNWQIPGHLLDKSPGQGSTSPCSRICSNRLTKSDLRLSGWGKDGKKTIISYHILSYHIISYHITSYHINFISYHIISYHIISHHISSYLISYPCSKKMEVMILLMEEILHHLVKKWDKTTYQLVQDFLPSTVWYTIYAGGITFQGLAAQNANLWQIIRRTCVYAPWLQPLAMHEPSTSKSRQDLRMLHILTQILGSFFLGGKRLQLMRSRFSWSSSTMARITNLPQLKCYTPRSLRASLPPERMDAWKTRSSFLLGARYCHFSGDFAVKPWVCHSFWWKASLLLPDLLLAKSKVQTLVVLDGNGIVLITKHTRFWEGWWIGEEKSSAMISYLVFLWGGQTLSKPSQHPWDDLVYLPIHEGLIFNGFFSFFSC